MPPPFEGPLRRGRLRRLRLDRDLTQAELAERAGISKRSLERIEKSRDGEVNLRHLVRLALALECESVLEVIDEEWLIAQDGDSTVVSYSALLRSAGADPPPPRRERARRRS